MDTNQFIEKLAQEGARKPMLQPWVQIICWLIGTGLWLAFIAHDKGLRPDFVQKLSEIFYVPELVLLVAASLSAAVAALYLSRPDARQMQNIRFAPLGFLALWFITAILNSSPMPAGDLTALTDMKQLDCTKCILELCVVPGIAFFLMVRSGAPIASGWAGAMAALSVSTIAYLYMRLIEANDNPVHLLLFHALPVFLLCLAGMVAGKMFMRLR